MIEQYKSQLQVGAWIVVLVLALSAIWLVQSIDQMRQEGNVSDTLMVSGTGKILAKPDIAITDLAINVEAPTAASAQTEANKKSQAVVDFLKGRGIEEEDIRTSSYNIYPQYDYTDGRSIIRGYQVTQSLTVKIREMDKANTVLDGVVDAGVNQVGGLNFTIDDPEQLKADARAKAIADANEKAKELEDQLGVNLGKIVSFSEMQDGYYPVAYMKSDMMAAGRGGGSEAAPMALPAGENEIVVTVNITYQIQ
jgi:hypothetical protein